jgi:hypothetical protein
VGRGPVELEQAVDGPIFRARAVLETASGALRGREAPATPEVAAGRVAVPAVQAPATAVRAPATEVRAPAVPIVAPLTALPVLVTAAQAPATAVRARAAPTAGPAEVPVPVAHTVVPAAPLRLRPAGTPTPARLGIAPSGLRLTGARLQVAGRKRSGPRHLERVVAGLRTVGGTGQRLDVTAQLLRGGTAPEVGERPKQKTSPTLGRSRARSAEQPRPVATCGRGHLERRGPNRPLARGESSPAGAGESRGLRVLRIGPPVAGRPPPAATDGPCRL